MPLDVPENDEAIDDADDDQRNPTAADKQLRPDDDKEGGVQASNSEASCGGAPASGDRKRPCAEGQLVCALTSSAH
jgi:hypothetical protein